MTDRLKQLLDEKIVIFDGAMGTEIYKRNFFVNVSFENLCLTSPKIIREIHKSYADAGAMVLTANSYGANRLKLAKFGLAENLEQINRAAVRLARECAGPERLVGASVGPAGEFPAGETGSHEKKTAVLREQVRCLAMEQPDFILFETILTIDDLECALEAAGAAPEIPYVVSLALDRNARTKNGESFTEAFDRIGKVSRKPTAFGLNCGSGPGDMLHALEEINHTCPLPLIAQPNAGNPKAVDNRMLYMCSPEYFTTYAVRYLALGVRGIGGCCGMSPEHIADMARSVAPMAKADKSKSLTVAEPVSPLKEPVPVRERSSLAEKLYSGKWVHTIEIVPPQGYMLAQTVEKSRLCKEAGFDAVNIPDGPRASCRVSPLVTAFKIHEGAGIETVLHVCCRDRNLIGLQAELLGCAALDIRNILFITGDPPKLGDYPFASGVFDTDSIGSVKIQSRLNRGADAAGKAVDVPTQAFIMVGADPNAVDFKREIRRTLEKIDAGAEAVVTQPVFDVDALFRFMEKIPALAEKKIPLIAGIWPLASYRNAEFMRNEVPGVTVPDRVMERMAKAETKEEQRLTGISIAREAVAAVRKTASGVQISAPFGNINTAIAVMK